MFDPQDARISTDKKPRTKCGNKGLFKTGGLRKKQIHPILVPDVAERSAPGQCYTSECWQDTLCARWFHESLCTAAHLSQINDNSLRPWYRCYGSASRCQAAQYATRLDSTLQSVYVVHCRLRVRLYSMCHPDSRQFGAFNWLKTCGLVPHAKNWVGNSTRLIRHTSSF